MPQTQYGRGKPRPFIVPPRLGQALPQNEAPNVTANARGSSTE